MDIFEKLTDILMKHVDHKNNHLFYFEELLKIVGYDKPLINAHTITPWTVEDRRVFLEHMYVAIKQHREYPDTKYQFMIAKLLEGHGLIGI